MNQLKICYEEKRAMAVDRIFGIGDVLNLDSEIIHLAVNILDLYVKDWNCPNIQIVCVCCIRIAVKFYSDNIKLSYVLLSKYISQYSPIQCFIKTEEAIFIKINYKIPLVTQASYILEFINELDLTKQINRDIRFNVMYLIDYLLFFPNIYYTTHYKVLIVGVTLISGWLIKKKKKSVYTGKYVGIDTYYITRHKVLTSKRYINMFMFL